MKRHSSDESGREEVYLRPFSPDLSAEVQSQCGKWQVSAAGGYQPGSNKNGTGSVATDSRFRTEAPKFLSQGPNQGSLATFYSWWDLGKDNKRFLFLTPAAQTTQAPFTVVLNWPSLLKK